uniref:Uncharacterized protein n=1 Tax=Nelumbo nucifera TaxID=4432 RepID=A0A823A1H6_NELNU|nr:TPA_asm: hypothetical protein HUJ06_019096 [Nelumbo nucifera]
MATRLCAVTLTGWSFSKTPALHHGPWVTTKIHCPFITNTPLHSLEYNIASSHPHVTVASPCPIFLPALLSAFSISILRRSPGYANIEIEYMLAMIKPDLFVGNYTNTTKRSILQPGFSIIKEMMTTLKRSFFPSHIKYLTSISAICGLDSE